MALSAMQPKSTTTNCPLLKLPPELRLCIYEKLFKIHKAELALVNTGGVWYRSAVVREARVPGECVTLLATCKKLYFEAKPVLYANVQFTLYCEGEELSEVVADSERPVDLLDAVKNVHTIRLQLEYDAREMTTATFRKALLPLVHAVSSASSARKVLIHLNIRESPVMQLKQGELDGLMHNLEDFQSSAEFAMRVKRVVVAPRGTHVARLTHAYMWQPERGLCSASFDTLLRKLLKQVHPLSISSSLTNPPLSRVDEIWKVWLAHLGWEKHHRERYTHKITTHSGEELQIRNELRLLCHDAGVEYDAEDIKDGIPLCILRKRTDKISELRFDIERLMSVRRKIERKLQDSEDAIADLERKLESA